MDFTIIIISIIIIVHIAWHYIYIVKNSGMNAKYKAVTILITWLLIIGILFYKYDFNALYVIPLLGFAFWIIKDAVLGYLLHKDIFYLGTGKWDRCMDRMFIGGRGLLIFKLVALLFFSGLLKYI